MSFPVTRVHPIRLALEDQCTDDVRCRDARHPGLVSHLKDLSPRQCVGPSGRLHRRRRSQSVQHPGSNVVGHQDIDLRLSSIVLPPESMHRLTWVEPGHRRVAECSQPRLQDIETPLVLDLHMNQRVDVRGGPGRLHVVGKTVQLDHQPADERPVLTADRVLQLEDGGPGKRPMTTVHGDDWSTVIRGHGSTPPACLDLCLAPAHPLNPSGPRRPRAASPEDDPPSGRPAEPAPSHCLPHPARAWTA